HTRTPPAPASAGMRWAQAMLGAQWPWSVLALALTAGVIIAILVRSGRPHPSPARTPGPLWTIAPVGWVAIVVAAVLLSPRTPPAPAAGALRVRVIGHQWGWGFRYPALGRTTATE